MKADLWCRVKGTSSGDIPLGANMTLSPPLVISEDEIDEIAYLQERITPELVMVLRADGPSSL